MSSWDARGLLHHALTPAEEIRKAERDRMAWEARWAALHAEPEQPAEVSS